MRTVSVATAALALLVAAAALPGVAPPAAGHFAGKRIVIDAGHGGNDPGAVGFGLKEKDVTLDVALRLRTLLQNDGAAVSMTRTTDETVEPDERIRRINASGALRLVSIHCNAHTDPSAHGTEAYYYSGLPSDSVAADLTRDVLPYVVDALDTTNRGVKAANFFQLRESSMPATLVELAFITNAADNGKLASPTYRQAAAVALLNGVQKHLGLPVHSPDTTPPSVGIVRPARETTYANDAVVPVPPEAYQGPIEGAIVVAGPLRVVASAVDNPGGSGVEYVDFFVDNEWRSRDTTSPYEWRWDVPGMPPSDPEYLVPGERTIKAVGKDHSGNFGVGTRTVTIRVV